MVVAASPFESCHASLEQRQQQTDSSTTLSAAYLVRGLDLPHPGDRSVATSEQTTEEHRGRWGLLGSQDRWTSLGNVLLRAQCRGVHHLFFADDQEWRSKQ
jgi:hypothetical protein